MFSNMKIFVVIPAYNVATVITRVLRELSESGFDNVIVVDDGSSDNTYDTAKKSSAFVLKHFINRGQGAALQTGTTYALSLGADIIVHFDGDGQMQVVDIETLISPLASNQVDIVLGSRYLHRKTKIPFIKRYIYFPIGKMVNLFFTGLWLTDAHCGFRALNRHAAETIQIRQDRMAHASEILEEININSLRYKEVPVTIIYHKFGQGLLGINGALRTVADLIKAKLLK